MAERIETVGRSGRLRPWLLVLWLAFVAAVAVAVTLDVSRLQDEAGQRGEVSALLLHLEAGTYDQRLAEQHALVDPRRLGDARATIARASRRLAADVERIDSLDPDRDIIPTAGRLASYEGALRQVLALIGDGRIAQARQNDDRSVTPLFEHLVRGLEVLAPKEGAEADQAQKAAQRRSILSPLVGIVGILVPLFAVVALRRRARRAGAREQLLQQSERRFRALVQNASDTILVIDGDGTVKTAQGSAGELLGYATEDLVGTQLWRIVHPADVGLAKAFCSEAAGSQRSGESMEWRLAQVDGSWSHCEVAAADLTDDPAVGGVMLTIRDVSRRKELEQQLRHRAFHDPLTQLPNRALFLDRAEHALVREKREGGAIAVLFVDLDDFKVVNDRLGHAVGDELLLEAARRLSACVRSADTVARLGGDEFGALIEDVMSASEPVQVAERMVAALREPFTLGGEQYTVGASVGVVVSDGAGDNADELMRRADLAMYAAKAHGKSRYELFDSALERAYDGRAGQDDASAGDRVTFFLRSEEQRAEIESLLARDDSPEIVVQPLLDLRTGRVAGYEALSRFAGSQRPPNAWFSQAHRFALGSRLEARAIERALALPGRPEGTYLSINVSPSALVSGEVWEVLPPDLSGLVVEVTENELAFSNDTLTGAIGRLRARGARLAVDDAGAGYAGLKQLMHLDPDLIKLDRTIVTELSRHPTKAALVEAIARYARRIGAMVCAEGVELIEDLRALVELDVTYAQGWAIARPGPAWPGIERAAQVACDVRDDVLAEAPVANGPESGERILERIVAELSAVDSRPALNRCLGTVVRDLDADEVHICTLDPTGTYLETVSDVGSVLEGTRWLMSDFPTTERVLREQEAVQVSVRDPDADPAESDLLEVQGIASMLMVPILYGGRTVGLLEVYAVDERPWSRGEVYRARIIAYQLGAVLQRLDAAAEHVDSKPERSPTLDEVAGMRARAQPG
jgi:diguanylate cyclase (GGDEF)-like protein/PAS domain S-box-containing protein